MTATDWFAPNQQAVRPGEDGVGIAAAEAKTPRPAALDDLAPPLETSEHVRRPAPHQTE